MPEHRVLLAANLTDRFGAQLLGISALAIPPRPWRTGWSSARLPRSTLNSWSKRLQVGAIGFAGLPAMAVSPSADQRLTFQWKRSQASLAAPILS
jgi:hypothetical protein